MAGISDEVFWSLSPIELDAVLIRRNDLERAKYLRAGLIAATIVNVNRKRGTPPAKPSDFIRVRPRPEDFMRVDEARRVLDGWAEEQNKLAQEGQQ